MRIFITGIAGFLGSWLADWYHERGHEVTGCDNFLGGTTENVNKKIPWHFWDITNTDIATLAGLMYKCDIVYHCAAMPYEGVSVFAPGFISDNIYSGSINVFSAAIKANVRRIVYCSSMARYGTNRTPFLETYEPKPQDPYGISKEAAERVLNNLAETHGFEYVIAVPHNIYGPRQRYHDPYRNVASIMINLMLQGRQPIIYGDGQQKRCFSYITDTVGCLGELGLGDFDGETINIGPDEEFVSINELAFRLGNIIGFSVNPIYMPDRPCEVKLATCSANKARALLGYETKVSLNEGLTNLVEWIREKGPKPFQYHFNLEFTTDKTPRTWTERIF